VATGGGQLGDLLPDRGELGQRHLRRRDDVDREATPASRVAWLSPATRPCRQAAFSRSAGVSHPSPCRTSMGVTKPVLASTASAARVTRRSIATAAHQGRGSPHEPRPPGNHRRWRHHQAVARHSRHKRRTEQPA
jgi:hypothetical protein